MLVVVPPGALTRFERVQVMSDACSAVAVANVAALDAESFYEDHVSSSLPLLIRDERLHTLRRRWSDEYLSELAGAQMHAELRLSADSASDSFPLVKVVGERPAPHSVADFLARYRSPARTTNLYATNLIIHALRHEYPLPRFTSLLDHGCASGWCGGLWLGAGGQRSALHRDFAENVHLVLQVHRTAIPGMQPVVHIPWCIP